MPENLLAIIVEAVCGLATLLEPTAPERAVQSRRLELVIIGRPNGAIVSADARVMYSARSRAWGWLL